MRSTELARAREIARGMAADLAPAKFYSVETEALARSAESFGAEPSVRRAYALLASSGENLGHGVEHGVKVALDAGAIVVVETRDLSARSEEAGRCLALAQIAGLLHDRYREAPNHAERGAEQASEVLGGWGLPSESVTIVEAAIRAHEAFRAWKPPENRVERIVAGSLYDADKFRWGVDNFTEMLWLMADSRGIPLQAILDHYEIGIQGIVRIKETFRTRTGRKYGPEIIDLGLDLGRRLFENLRAGGAARGS